MLASKSLPTHYNESIFKQKQQQQQQHQLKSVANPIPPKVVTNPIIVAASTAGVVSPSDDNNNNNNKDLDLAMKTALTAIKRIQNNATDIDIGFGTITGAADANAADGVAGTDDADDAVSYTDGCANASMNGGRDISIKCTTDSTQRQVRQLRKPENHGSYTRENKHHLQEISDMSSSAIPSTVIDYNDTNNNNVNKNKMNGDYISEKKSIIASHPDPHYETYIRECIDHIIKLAVLDGTNRSNKVVEWHAPEELRKLFDFELRAHGEPHVRLVQLLKQTIQYSVKTGHPYFINQLYSGVDPYALIGQWLTDALNPSVYTYEVAPVFTLMEEQVLHEMRRIVGFPNDGFGDGIFCPGGSIANGYAISCARFKFVPETKKLGLFASKRLIVFTSEDAHYSVEKLAMFMGIGSDNVCKIATTPIGKMDLNALESQIEHFIAEGCLPMMVSATAGTTVLGAFDDLPGIADICEKYKLWMHVDAAWGGGALVSKKYRQLLKGIERADSVTWNPHKLLTASQQCSTFLTRHKDVLSQCHSTNATYLFQKDKFYDTSFDTGDKHIQCGRRADVFKFWFMWKAKGTNGLEEHINQIFEMSEYFTEQLKSRPGFELVLEKPECTNISFWYIPPSLRNMERNAEFKAKLHAVAPKIKERMIKKGSMMITYQPMRKLPNFFRLVLQNSCLKEADMLYFLDEIEELGNNL